MTDTATMVARVRAVRLSSQGHVPGFLRLVSVTRHLIGGHRVRDTVGRYHSD